MTMNHRLFTSISSDKISRLVKSAHSRVVLAVPAILINVAKAVIEIAPKIGKDKITLIFDCDDEVFRLGYGEFEALKLLTDFGLFVRQAPGLRIGVLICDNRAWVFSPTALYVQPEVHSDETPNAIEMRVSDLEHYLGSLIPVDPSPVSADNIEIGNEPISDAILSATQHSLKVAPPVPFDIARQVRVFQPYIQYVELHLNGCSIDRHVVKIPSDVLNTDINKELEKRLKTSFNLISKTSSISSKALDEELNRIRKEYIKSLGKNWGNVILKARRPEFDKKIETLKKKVEEHQKKLESKLQSEIDKSKEQIVDAFWQNIQKNPPKDLLGQILESKPTEQNAKEWLRMKLEGCFPSAQQLSKKMVLECQFKDVTFETLNTQGFSEALKKAYPLIDWDKPFDEFRAAKEKG